MAITYRILHDWQSVGLSLGKRGGWVEVRQCKRCGLSVHWTSRKRANVGRCYAQQEIDFDGLEWHQRFLVLNQYKPNTTDNTKGVPCAS